MSRLYVGPAGALTEFDLELNNALAIDTPAVTAVHTSLTGATSRDVFGYGRTWSASWDWLMPSEIAQISAWALGRLGDLWLVEDGPEPNLLPLVDPRPLLPGATPTTTIAPSGLDRLSLVPPSVTLRTPVVPAVPGRGARVDVEVSGNVTVTLEALDASLTVLSTATPVSAGSTLGHRTVRSSTFTSTDPAFWRVKCVTGTGSVLLGDLAVTFDGPRLAYSPPGASARVLVDSSSASRAHWTESGGSIVFRKA